MRGSPLKSTAGASSIALRPEVQSFESENQRMANLKGRRPVLRDWQHSRNLTNTKICSGLPEDEVDFVEDPSKRRDRTLRCLAEAKLRYVKSEVLDKYPFFVEESGLSIPGMETTCPHSCVHLFMNQLGCELHLQDG